MGLLPKRKCTSHSMTDLLKSYRMGFGKTRSTAPKLLFFCMEKISKHTIYFEKLIEKKHSVGNHTFDHLNGWKTTNNDYNVNISLCENSIKNNTIGIRLDSKFFALHMVK
jgi:hypothetical protein